MAFKRKAADTSAELFAAAALGLATLAITPAAQADAVSDFYTGKQLRILVGYGAGGDYDTVTRLMSKHLSKHIPGNPVIVARNPVGPGAARRCEVNPRRVRAAVGRPGPGVARKIQCRAAGPDQKSDGADRPEVGFRDYVSFSNKTGADCRRQPAPSPHTLIPSALCRGSISPSRYCFPWTPGTGPGE